MTDDDKGTIARPTGDLCVLVNNNNTERGTTYSCQRQGKDTDTTVGAAKRVEITVTGVVVGTPTAEDSVTVKVKTVPQGKNKLPIAKGATITVKRNTSGKTAFTLKPCSSIIKVKRG